MNKCRRDSRRHLKRGNNNKKKNRTWQCLSRDRRPPTPRRTEIRRKFCRGFNCCHLSQAKATMSTYVCKKTNVSGSILRGRERRYRGRAVNVTRCTRVLGVSKGDLLLMAYWNGMSTVIKRDGPTASWRSPLNVRRYIRARKGAGEPGTPSRGGRNRRIVFFLSARLHCNRGPREGSIKIISDALMRNYEGLLSFFIFAGSYSVKYHSFMNVWYFKLRKVTEIYFLTLFVWCLIYANNII